MSNKNKKPRKKFQQSLSKPLVASTINKSIKKRSNVLREKIYIICLLGQGSLELEINYLFIASLLRLHHRSAGKYT